MVNSCHGLLDTRSTIPVSFSMRLTYWQVSHDDDQHLHSLRRSSRDLARRFNPLPLPARMKRILI